MKPNALIKAYISARKPKLPVFFEDRFFDRYVESGIAMGIIFQDQGVKEAYKENYKKVILISHFTNLVLLNN